MRRTISILALPLVVVLAVLVMASVYIVDVREKALVLRFGEVVTCLLYTSPSPRDATLSRMPSSA